jgi:hypothetical protein
MRFDEFLELLLRTAGCTELRLRSSAYPGMKRYSFGDPSPYVLGCALRPGAYLSHRSALEVHGLLPADNRIYVNKEQSAKPPLEGRLSQEAITRAFANNARVSNYVLTWERYSFVLLSGKNTRRLDVSEQQLPDGARVEVTSLERSLVDATVRPSYCGGVENVAVAYAGAKGRLDQARLLKVLARLEYVYPYHQAVGFYMQRAGYAKAELEKIRSLGLQYDFYLAHKLQRPAYSPEWKIYYPRGL